MPGHLEKRGTDTWTIVIDIGRDKTGRRKRFKRAFRGTKKEAEKELARLLLEYESGIRIDSTTMRLGPYLENWLATKKASLSPKTYVRYGNLIKIINRYLGSMELEKVNALHLESFYRKVASTPNEKGKLPAPATVLYYHRVLSAALGDAADKRLIPYNPAQVATAPKQARPDVEYLTAEQAQHLLREARNTPYFALLATAIMTGLRRGELLGLRWQDVDFASGKIHVRQTLQYVDGQIFFKQPKTAGSRRAVSIPPGLVKILKEHKKRQLERQLQMAGEYKDNGLVFCRQNGEPIFPDTPSSWLPAFCEKIGLPRIKFHSLRHTCASLLLKLGYPSKVIADLLGHSSTRITDDIYSHTLPGIHENAVKDLEKIML